MLALPSDSGLKFWGQTLRSSKTLKRSWRKKTAWNRNQENLQSRGMQGTLSAMDGKTRRRKEHEMSRKLMMMGTAVAVAFGAWAAKETVGG